MSLVGENQTNYVLFFVLNPIPSNAIQSCNIAKTPALTPNSLKVQNLLGFPFYEQSTNSSMQYVQQN